MRCDLHCPPKAGVPLGAVAAVVAAAVLARALMSVAAALFFAVMAVNVAVAAALVRNLRPARRYTHMRAADTHIRIPTALPAPPLALEGRVVPVARTLAESARVKR